jgi:hypothetical protein
MQVTDFSIVCTCVLTYDFNFSTVMAGDVDGVVNHALCAGKECAQRRDIAEVQLGECRQRLDEVHRASLQVS